MSSTISDTITTNGLAITTGITVFLLIVSEIMALIPEKYIKANSIIQLFLNLAKMFLASRGIVVPVIPPINLPEAPSLVVPPSPLILPQPSLVITSPPLIPQRPLKTV